MGVRDELEAGLERIKTGWFGGSGSSVGSSYDPVCAWLAVDATISKPVNPAVKALHAQLPDSHDHCLNPDTCLIVFNNAETTTVDDVIELYKRAVVEAPLED